MSKGSLALVLAFIAASAMVGCGGKGSSPTAPSAPTAASGGVSLQGIVVGGTAAAASQPGRVGASDAGGRITVTVQENTSISTTVSINGTFKLDGLPSTGFTLVFTVNGVTVGTITISPVQGSTEIKIVVQVTSTTVVLVNIDVGDDNDNHDNNGTCIVEGGKVGRHIELEGKVDSLTATGFKLNVNGEHGGTGLVDVTTNGAQFKCNGKPTSGGCSLSTLKAGDQVHVKGTLTSCSTTAAAVTATEVKIQKEGDEGDD